MTYAVVCGQVVGSGPYEIVYSSDLQIFLTREAAIRHGFETRGSDDFNIASFDSDGKLCAFGWMDRDFGPDDYDIDRVREYITP